VFGDLRVNKRLAMRLEAVVRALLIRSHQPGITGHIGSENRGETAGSGHCSPAAIKFSNKFTLKLSQNLYVIQPRILCASGSRAAEVSQMPNGSFGSLVDFGDATPAATRIDSS